MEEHYHCKYCGKVLLEASPESSFLITTRDGEPQGFLCTDCHPLWEKYKREERERWEK